MRVDCAFYDDLDALARDADGRLDRANQSRMYDRLDWIARTVAHCPPPGRAAVVRVSGDAGTVWLPLSVRRGRAAALANWYTLGFDVIRDGDAEGALSLLPHCLRGIGHVALSPMESPEPVAHAFRAAGWHVSVEQASVNWRIAPGQDFAAFWAARPGKLRSTVQRKSKRAQLTIAIHREFSQEAWDAYRAIYEASWKGEEGSWPFLHAMARAEGANGTLRLGIARRMGVPVAAQLWTVEHGRATIHKLAYREDAREWSPGSILSHAMFEHVIETDRPALIDYGTGDQPYKADWMDTPAPLWRIEATDPHHPVGWATLIRRGMAKLVRRSRDG